MKFQQGHHFWLSLALAGLLTWAAGCGNGNQGTSDGHDSIDSPQVVKVEPQEFPVNNLPDSLFGKEAVVSEDKALKVTPGKLQEQQVALPEWLDQILSRESIVRFANGILTAMPEEVEFVQSSAIVYDAGDGLKAFVVTYTTRPSSASMIVYGAWVSEEQSYWSSTSSKDKLEMKLQGVKLVPNGVELVGDWATGPVKSPFKATLRRGGATLVKGKS